MPSVFDLVATLSLDSKEYEEDLDKSKKSALSKLGSGLKTAGAIGAAAIGATTAAVGTFAGAGGLKFDSGWPLEHLPFQPLMQEKTLTKPWLRLRLRWERAQRKFRT